MSKTPQERKNGSKLEDGFEGACLSLLQQIARGQKPLGSRWPKSQLQILLSRGWLQKKETGFALTNKGKSALRRQKLHREEIRLSGQESNRTTEERVRVKAQSSRSDANAIKAESPLQHLANRKKGDGSTYLSTSQVEAGERLCSDFIRGQLVKTLGINWQGLGEEEGAISKNARRAKASRNLGDAALDAQDRFRAALKYVGEEFADPLIDFCCFQKGLEEMERTRNWPARSAKLVLSLALARLARHYGLFDEAKGPTRNAIRHWGTRDYRPNLSNSDEC
nr:DUF6456 domain-containing protein [uncultured Cohaesibacter sp.]